MQLARRRPGATLALAAAISLAGGAARAVPVLTFGQATDADLVDATNPTPSTTEIAGVSIPVLISQLQGVIVGPPGISAYLSMSLASMGAASVGGGLATEAFSGAASFTSGTGGTGVDYLSATFTNTVFGLGGGSVLGLVASEPPGAVAFASTVLPQSILQDPKGISFSFADVTGPVTVADGTLAAFTSTVSGTISANAAVIVPEPASLTLLAAGLVVAGAGLARRRPGG